MKNILIIFLIIFAYNDFTAQLKTFKTDFVVAYNVEYPINKRKNTEQFLLFINSKDNISFYRSTNQYVLDSLTINNKINSSDFMATSQYGTAMGEEVLKMSDNFIVYEQVVDSNIKYVESSNLKWTILDDRKIYSGYNTRKAFTYAYGRKWIAWFAETLPLDYGPYKFSGLPGLIINMYDEKAEYFFTLTVFKKKNKQINLPRDEKYKQFSKQKAKQLKFNSLSNLNGLIIEDPIERKRLNQVNQRRIKELPVLDTE